MRSEATPVTTAGESGEGGEGGGGTGIDWTSVPSASSRNSRIWPVLLTRRLLRERHGEGETGPTASSKTGESTCEEASETRTW